MEYDDWIFDSIKRYKSLSMYDMQHCITAMDWVSGRSLCVGTSSGQKHELLELKLPVKMLETEDTAVPKLKIDKDFRVHTGGFCKTRIADLKHIPNTRFCMTAADGETSVCVWKMGDNNTDLMREEKTVHSTTSTGHPTRISICTDGATPRAIAFASTLSNITVLDCETFEKIKDGSGRGNGDQISSIYHQTSDLLHCCTTQGDLYICDLRCDKVKVAHQHKTETKQASDVYWTMTRISDQSNSLLQVSSLGEVLVFDARFMDKCVRKLHVDHSGRSDGLCIQGSRDGRHFSLSGMDGLVYIYSNADKEVTDTLKPVFIHEGHVMNCDSQSDSPVVVGHMWHPWQQDLIISTATDCSLHAWQYNTS